MKYILLPFAAWIIAGSLKFAINFLRNGKKAKDLIGYGGFPSTHTTILSSGVFSVGFAEGFYSPIFAFALSVLIITTIDAHGLRRHVGLHAKEINKAHNANLRERMGHTYVEIFGGLVLGAALSYAAYVI